MGTRNRSTAAAKHSKSERKSISPSPATNRAAPPADTKRNLWSYLYSLRLHQVDAQPEQPLKESDYVWNFAYGSNMCKRVVYQRRQLRPAESVRGVLKDWRLCFMESLPYVEPGMGNAQPSPGDELHGVLHKLSPKDYAKLLATEGGGHPGWGYQKVEVDCLAEDGRTIRAVVLSDPKRLSFDPLPSRRYLSLLREGAADYGLPQSYRQRLEALPHFEAPVLPRVLGFMVGLPLIFAYSIIGLALNLLGCSTLLASVWFHYTRCLVWTLYWAVLNPIAGSSGHARSTQPPWLFSARAAVALGLYLWAWWVGCGWLGNLVRQALLGGSGDSTVDTGTTPSV